MKKITLLSSIVLGLLGLTACYENIEFGDSLAEPKLPAEVMDYASLRMPVHLQNSFLSFSNNIFGNTNAKPGVELSLPPTFFDTLNGGNNQRRVTFGPNNPIVTNHGATLGRVLFYDTRLSINNSIACASCHKQELAFSDGVRFSKGFGGKTTPRNSMAILNAGLNHNLFWDSRVQSVTQLALEPVRNHIEMGMESMDVLEKKLANTNFYPELFAKAYGSSEVSSKKIADAMAQFVCSIISSNSKFDHGVEKNFNNFTELEKMGKALFFSAKAKCSECHAGSNFAAPDNPFSNDPYGSPEIKGTAVIGLELQAKDKGKSNGNFRIPSLRNVALTAPYMHDGRFATLEQVVDHYNSGIVAQANLDPKFIDQEGRPLKMNLNALEKKALIAFLKTLTDEQMIKDQRFANPFK
jgi:cytochrome c peroxidase